MEIVNDVIKLIKFWDGIKSIWQKELETKGKEVYEETEEESERTLQSFPNEES